MFTNAKHTRINGGNFFIVNNNQDTEVQSEIDLLRKQCALGALLDSNERFDPPRCAAETRAALIEEVLSWIYGGEGAASMTWLFGGAGAGKSALAQTIAEICQREGSLAGSFFFSRTSTAERSDGNRLVPTLVFQLLDTFPDVKPLVGECIKKHAGLFDRSPRAQMDLLFIKPLIYLKRPISSSLWLSRDSPRSFSTPSIPTAPSKGKSHQSLFSKMFRKNPTNVEKNAEDELSRPRLIVIDGLDECNRQEIQIDLLRILAEAIRRLPFPFRILLASRPEGHIMRTIHYDDYFEGLDIREIDLGDDKNADEDIRRFLERGFKEVHRVHRLRSLLDPSWPPKGAITTLVQKSSSHFIYAATAMKYIQYPRGRPDRRLEVILGLSTTPTTDKPFAQLDALYTHIFMSLEEGDRTTVNRVFGILNLAGDPRYSLGTSPAKIEEYLGMQAGEIELLLEPLLSLIVLPENRSLDIRILHASLFDYLQDVSRSGILHLDLPMAHGVLANFWLKGMQTHTLAYILALKQIENSLQCPFDHWWRSLRHCQSGRLTDELKEYLCTFPFLYDVILHPSLMSKLLSYNDLAISFIPICLQTFLTVILEKDINDGNKLHYLHSMQIEQRLQSIHGGSDPCLLHDTTMEPVFEDRIFQDRHRIHKAYIIMLLTYFPSVQNVYKILLKRTSRGPEDTETNLQSHILVVLLPHMTSSLEDLELCERNSELSKYTNPRDNELLRVLLQRLKEYFLHIEPKLREDGHTSRLRKCKDAWGIV